MTDEPVRIKDVTIGNEPSSQILYIRGLTRPFSLMQLKGLLCRYGTLIDGEFWLDKIKSQCFVRVKILYKKIFLIDLFFILFSIIH
jgi:hypothetical protein